MSSWIQSGERTGRTPKSKTALAILTAMVVSGASIGVPAEEVSNPGSAGSSAASPSISTSPQAPADKAVAAPSAAPASSAAEPSLVSPAPAATQPPAASDEPSLVSPTPSTQPPQPKPAKRPAVTKGDKPLPADAEGSPADTGEDAPSPQPKRRYATPEELGKAMPSVDIGERGRARAKMLQTLYGGEVVLLDALSTSPPTVTEPLQLDQAVAYALQNNFEVLGAEAKAEASGWELVGGYGQYVPRVEYQYQRGKERSQPATFQDSSGATVPDNRHNRRDKSLTITQQLIDPVIIADIVERHTTKDADDQEFRAVREKAALDTINSFFRLVQSRLSIRFAEEYKSSLDRLSARMNDRVEGGGASKVELDRIRARSVTAKSAIIEARSEYQAALVEFHRLTGVVPLKLRLPVVLTPTLPETVDQVVGMAMSNNPDYQAMNKRSDAATEEMTKSFAKLLPKLSVQITHTRSWDAGGIANQPVTANKPVYPFDDERRVMGVFTWTLNGGVDAATGMANAARARQASYVATDTRTKLEESIHVSYDALNAASGRIQAVNQAVESSRNVATAFEEQYLAASRPLLDLLDADERLYQSKVELSRLVIAETGAGFLIRRQMGDLVPAIFESDDFDLIKARAKTAGQAKPDQQKQDQGAAPAPATTTPAKPQGQEDAPAPQPQAPQPDVKAAAPDAAQSAAPLPPASTVAPAPAGTGETNVQDQTPATPAAQPAPDGDSTSGATSGTTSEGEH